MMVHKAQQNPGAAVPDGADADWDLVDSGPADPPKLPQDPSSFVFVLRDKQGEPAVGSMPPSPAKSSGPNTPPLAPQATPLDARKAHQPKAPVVRSAPASTPEEARARMSNSPQLPMSVDPHGAAAPRGEWANGRSPPPPALPAPLEDNQRLRRELGTLALEEQRDRTLMSDEATAEHQSLLMERRAERQRLGDSTGTPSAAGDLAIAQRIQREERAKDAEREARRRAEEEQSLAVAATAEKLKANLERAKQGLTSSKCECLGASIGHHRPHCPNAR